MRHFRRLVDAVCELCFPSDESPADASLALKLAVLGLLGLLIVVAILR
jgi:hypothetical protein